MVCGKTWIGQAYQLYLHFQKSCNHNKLFSFNEQLAYNKTNMALWFHAISISIALRYDMIWHSTKVTRAISFIKVRSKLILHSPTSHILKVLYNA